MSRRGALALVTATAVLATMAHAGEAAAPERLTLAKRLELGLVAVEARVGGDQVLASGTVVDAERGLILTSARSVWGATSLKLDTGLGILHGRIIARAPCDELALVETQPRLPGLVSLTDNVGRRARPRQPRDRPTAAVAPRPGGGLLTLPSRVAAAPLGLDAAARPGGRRRPGARRRGPPGRDRRRDRRGDAVDGDRAAARRAQARARSARSRAGRASTTAPSGCTGSPARRIPASARTTRA